MRQSRRSGFCFGATKAQRGTCSLRLVIDVFANEICHVLYAFRTLTPKQAEAHPVYQALRINASVAPLSTI